jgi:hypothetical protein
LAPWLLGSLAPWLLGSLAPWLLARGLVQNHKIWKKERKLLNSGQPNLSKFVG